jgi:hypothetical protein
MTKFTRRDLLRLGALAGVGGTLLDARPARALLFGEAPADKIDSMLVEDRRVTSVLEVFLFGGLSQYESLYCVEEFGQGDGTQYHAFSQASIEAALGDCGVSGAPQLLENFATDANGVSVKLGPFAIPLRQRPDLLERLRICVTAHDLEPHEAAVPMALTGRPVGHSASAGLGTCVQRFRRERDPVRETPHSYVLRTQSPVLFDLTRPATATGLHPTSARPLTITIDASTNVASLLERKKLGADRDRFDALVAANVQRFDDRLRWKGSDPVRSVRLSDLHNAADTVSAADVIREVLKPELLQPISSDRCGKLVAHDSTATSLGLARYLLTHPTDPAGYICLIDGGYFDSSEDPSQAGGYDTHDENIVVQSRNLFGLLTNLCAIINQPGENDPTKLDLDRTLIVLNTEFGRTPGNSGGSGRGHWPYGYPVAYLGGPIRNDNRGVFGSIGADARAIEHVSQREHRLATLLSLGIWPFSPESYNVSDVDGANTESGAARSVVERVLGIA